MTQFEQDAPQSNPPGLSESIEKNPQRSRVLKSLLWLMGAVAILALVNLARLDRLTGDQFTLLAVVHHAQDSSVYHGDGLFQDPSWYQSYLPWYRSLAFHLTEWTGDGAVAMWAMSVGLTASMGLAFWLLFYWLKIDPMLATVGAVIGILPRAATSSELTGAGIIESALPRTFFSVGLPLAIFLIIKTKGQGRWCVAGFFLIGLLGNFHPQSAFFATAGLLLLLLAQGCGQRKVWMQVSVCGLAAVLGVLPFGLSYPWEATATSAKKAPTRLGAIQNLLVAGGNSPGQTKAEKDPKEELGISTESAVADSSDNSQELSSEEEIDPQSLSSFSMSFVKRVHYALRLMNYEITFPVFFLAVVPMALAVRLLRSDREDQSSPLVSSGRFCYLTAVLIGSLSIGCELMNRILATWHLSIPFLDSVQPLRATRLVAPLCVAAFFLLLSKYKGLESLSIRRVQWGLMLMLFPVGVTMAGGEYIFQTRYRPVQEAARWAKENTEPGTLFLVDPPSALAFRVWAKRPVVWAHHDAVCVPTPFRPQARTEIREIERAFKSDNLRRLLRLAQDYDVKYVYCPDHTTDPSSLDRDLQVGPFLSVQTPEKTTRVASPLEPNAAQAR